MAILNQNVPTLLDRVKSINPDGSEAAIVELLAQTNPLIEDGVWKEGNSLAGESVTVRTGLPAVYFRLLNQLVPSSKATTAQVQEQTAIMESWLTIEKEVAELNGNSAEFRAQQASAHIEAMGQAYAEAFFYGNSSQTPAEFTGLSARYSSLSAGNAQNIIDAGGSGSDNMSIWLVGWGLNSVYSIYPKGSKAGLDHKNLGEQVVEAGGMTGSVGLAYRERFQMKPGLVVADWRYAVRICNIDVSTLVANPASGADLPSLMIRATHRLHSLSGVRPVFYMNRTAVSVLDEQRRADVVSGGGLSYQDVDGKLVPHFRGIPIKTTDALLETEARVV